MLSEYALAFQLQPQHLQLPSDLEDIQALRNRRQQLIECKNQEIYSLDVQTSSILKDSLQKHIQWISLQITDIEQHIQNVLDQNQEIRSKLNQLISIPGVGQQLALTVLTELPQAGKGEFKKLTSLVGLALCKRKW